MDRMETDSIGSCPVPAEAYYGIHTVRAIENFPITGRLVHPALIGALIDIKKAAAIVHRQAGLLPPRLAEAIIQACDDLADGMKPTDFPVDAIQGGAGTSTNMNVNEVIANRALEILGQEKGCYALIHPNDHVNLSQSTNDVYPTAGRMALLRLLPALLGALADLNRSLARKAKQCDTIVKLGRTQLSDAIPIRLGQEFQAWRAALQRAAVRLRQHMKPLRIVNLGGTAIGTCLNADPYYLANIIPVLNEITGLDLRRAVDLVDATQNTDDYLALSSALRGCAVVLAKLANDLRLLSSGPKGGLGEITLPARQNGSSIMPGKINPVIPEVVNQIAFAVIGHDVTAALVAEAGQLELNAFEPVLFDQLLSDIVSLTHGIRTLDINCIRGISANSERCRELLDRSTALATALAPVIGYQRSAAIAKRALRENRSIQDLVEQEGLDDRMLQACLAAASKCVSGSPASDPA